MSQRFAIRFVPWFRVLSTVLGLPPSRAYVDVADDEVEVGMGWSFRARFPRAAVASARPLEMRPLSRGVHGFAGRWLVNGSGDGIVGIELRPDQRARVIGFPVSLRELWVSVDDPPALLAALAAARHAA